MAYAGIVKSVCRIKPLTLFSGSFTANGTTVTHEYVQIDACGCEMCQYNPFSPTVAQPEQIKLKTR